MYSLVVADGALRYHDTASIAITVQGGMWWYACRYVGRYRTARHGTARHGTARHGMARHGTIQYSAVWCSGLPHGTARYVCL